LPGLLLSKLGLFSGMLHCGSNSGGLGVFLSGASGLLFGEALPSMVLFCNPGQ
jgi:hypothetical protein